MTRQEAKERLADAQIRRRLLRQEVDAVNAEISMLLDELESYEPLCPHGRRAGGGCWDCAAVREEL